MEHDKMNQMAKHNVDNKDQKLTTNMGQKVSNTDDSLKAGLRGPTLLEDFHLREKITHFDHERIPERVVHARGFGVHGVFQPYESMAQYTTAEFLQNPNNITPVFVRFSTVVGSRGSADTVRDIRGFATKFYTSAGNFDLVGNNVPVFFIQDAMKFPDFVHAIKPEPHNEVPQATSAHDTFWDFVVSTPETTHAVMWLMSDRGIPRSFRMMEGFGVNTYRFINAKGEAHFVKFHWKPLLGVHSLLRDEAQKLSGKDPDFHRKDIWNAIEGGNYPEFELGVQILAESREFEFDFDILDATKFWPEELIPVKIIGKMTLNRNVDNFFAETEQVAFCPANLVSGIDFSNDPLLQGRLFSYQDTQLIRLGGPNFHQIPINQPVAPVHNNQRDGFHRMTIDRGIVSYFPNTLQNNSPTPATEAEGGYVHYTTKVDGNVIRGRSDSFKDFFKQATLFWKSLSQAEKEHTLDAFHFEVGSVKDKALKQKVVDLFNNVDNEFAYTLADKLGADVPLPVPVSKPKALTPAVSQDNTIKSAMTRKIAVLTDDGFCWNDLTQMLDCLKSDGISAEIVSSKMGMITGDNGQQLEATKDYTTTESLFYDGVYVPGGSQSIINMNKNSDATNFLCEAFKHAKTIAATGEGINMLQKSSAHTIPMSTPESMELKTDTGVLTVGKPPNLTAFIEEFIKLLSMHRHWARH